MGNKGLICSCASHSVWLKIKKSVSIAIGRIESKMKERETKVTL